MSVGSGRSWASSGSHRRRPMFPKSEKEFLEDFYIRRREKEARQEEFWSQTSSYFDKAVRDSKKWDRLELCSRVAEKTYRECQRKEAQKAQLKVRRERLKRLLNAEAHAYEEELKCLPRSSTLEGLRDEREILRGKREEKARENARIKMEQHWKLNNPDFRELRMKKHREVVVEAWKKQSEEKQRVEEDERRREEARQRLLEASRLEEQEKIQNMEREKERRVVEWKSILLDQAERLRERRREEEELDFNISQELLKRDELKDLRDEMKKAEDFRQKKELGNYLRRQSRLKLRVRAQQIQDELEEDKRFLEKLRRLEEKENEEKESSRRKIMEDIHWMNKVLADQKKEEMRREKELDHLFSEEASNMWYKQEQIWAKEKAARERLMADMMSAVEEQLEAKLIAKRVRKDENQREQEALAKEIESMHACIAQEEEQQKAKKVSYAQELTDQIHSRPLSTSPPPIQSDPNEQTLNQLAHRLGQFNVKPQEHDISNFRRRRAKW